MRLAPVPLFFAAEGATQGHCEMAGESSRTTHGAPSSSGWMPLPGRADPWCARTALPTMNSSAQCSRQPESKTFGKPTRSSEPVATVASGSFRTKETGQVRGTGYVMDSLEAALWAFDQSTTFEEGALLAVNLGDDADTTGADLRTIGGRILRSSQASRPVGWPWSTCA